MGFQKGQPRHPRAGRKRGSSTNKYPKLLKDCLIMAAELEGSDNNGKDKMVGFLRMSARTELPSFLAMLSKVIPLQQDSKTDDTDNEMAEYATPEEIRRELDSRGLTVEVLRLLYFGPELKTVEDTHTTIEHEDAVDGGDPAAT
jgi:hypothetical protein